MKNTVQQRFYWQFERHFYLKNDCNYYDSYKLRYKFSYSFFFVFWSFVESNNKNQIFSRLGFWKRGIFCFLLIGSCAVLYSSIFRVIVYLINILKKYILQAKNVFCSPPWMHEECLTHFMPLVSFYTPWENQENTDFLMFSEGYRSRAVGWNHLKNRVSTFILVVETPL